MNKKKKDFLNILTGFGGKIIIIALSLIVPRLIMKNYGSEVNGFFSTLTNFYTYLALIEAGIGASSLQMLYKPVVNNDKKQINSILFTTKKLFRKYAIFYGIGVLAISLVLPFALKSSINKYYIFAIAILQGLSSLLNFLILGGIINLLTAEGKNYVKDVIALSVNILTSIAKIILVNLGTNIVVLQCVYFILSLIPIIIYKIYFSKRYKWLNLKNIDQKDEITLPQTKSFFIHQFSMLIFNHTDTILIGFFIGLKVASVYSIYYLIYTNLYTLVTSIFNNISYTLGQKYYSDDSQKKNYIKYHDGYKAFFCGSVFSIFTVTVILTTPFISLYTEGIQDISYIDPYLPLLFALTNLLSACRSTESNLINLSFHAKQTVWRSLLESIINIAVSLVLIQFIGVYGCLLGTIAALLYRTNDIIIYSNKRILKRMPTRAYLIVISNFALFFLFYFLFKSIKLEINNYVEFMFSGFALVMIVGLFFAFLNYLLNKNNLKYVLKSFASKK